MRHQEEFLRTYLHWLRSLSFPIPLNVLGYLCIKGGNFLLIPRFNQIFCSKTQRAGYHLFNHNLASILYRD